MSKDKFDLEQVFQRTDGRCHICGKHLSFSNYGTFGNKGAWEVDHSKPKAVGGTNHGNNLYPACISCNRRKGANSNKRMRAGHDRKRAPYSAKKIAESRNSNTLTGAFWGGLVGLRYGPPGLLVGLILGGIFGNMVDPEN